MPMLLWLFRMTLSVIRRPPVGHLLPEPTLWPLDGDEKAKEDDCIILFSTMQTFSRSLVTPYTIGNKKRGQSQLGYVEKQPLQWSFLRSWNANNCRRSLFSDASAQIISAIDCAPLLPSATGDSSYVSCFALLRFVRLPNLDHSIPIQSYSNELEAKNNLCCIRVPVPDLAP